MGLFIFLVFPGLSPLKDKEHHCSGFPGNCSQKGRMSETELGVDLHWGMLQCCEYTSWGPHALPNGKSSPFTRPGLELKKEAFLTQLTCPKAECPRVTVTHTMPFLVRSGGSLGKSKDPGIASVSKVFSYSNSTLLISHP